MTLGHAYNKILKDIVNRYKVLQGYSVDFRPGWDCHGLPIELKAIKGSKKLDPLLIRKISSSFADSAIELQKKDLMQYGLMCDFEDIYKTKGFVQ